METSCINLSDDIALICESVSSLMSRITFKVILCVDPLNISRYHNLRLKFPHDG